jgi:hypothetical protein
LGAVVDILEETEYTTSMVIGSLIDLVNNMPSFLATYLEVLIGAIPVIVTGTAMTIVIAGVVIASIGVTLLIKVSLVSNRFSELLFGQNLFSENPIRRKSFLRKAFRRKY